VLLFLASYLHLLIYFLVFHFHFFLPSFLSILFPPSSDLYFAVFSFLILTFISFFTPSIFLSVRVISTLLFLNPSCYNFFSSQSHILCNITFKKQPRNSCINLCKKED
jgi:hypothetical protein